MFNLGNSFLIIILFLSVALCFLSEKYSFVEQERKDTYIMAKASALASEWFDIISKVKKEKGLIPPKYGNLKYPGLIGYEYSEITTTLGSLDAKFTANNPEFAALIVKFLDDAGIDSNSIVGVISSGSFPSLAISTLAALQIIRAKVILISSLGASSYGANDPLATWIDMENWLREKGGLNYRSSIVTLGAEDDSGLGLQEEGITLLEKAVQRCHVSLYKPKSFDESLNTKLKLLNSNKISLLINIGGSQVALGKCPHGIAIKNGFHKILNSCNDSDRGLIFRIAEKGIPVIHFLNIKSLAVEYGMPIAPEQKFSKSDILYLEKTPMKFQIVICLAIIASSLFLGGKINKGKKKNRYIN
jgi:poly-gamma-glutamate system protein